MKSSPKRCLVMEDSVPGVIAGRRAGMQVLGFIGGGHCGPDHAPHLTPADSHLPGSQRRT